MIPVGIMLIAVIVMLALMFTGRPPLNLGMDFTGGYSLTVQLGERLTGDNETEYFNRISDKVRGFEFEGYNHNIILRSYLREGTGADAALRVRFDPIPEVDDMQKDAIMYGLRNYLRDYFFYADPFGGDVIQGAMTGPTISAELMRNALLGLLAALVGMLIYIGFRFKRFLPGLATVCGLLHDVMIVIAFMAISRIEVSATFIAVIITVVGYSINSNIILFDRVRENLKSPMLKDKPLGLIANTAVRDTLTRNIIMTFTTILTVSLLAVIGVPSVRNFMLPIIVGFMSGTLSTIFIVPGLWVTFENMWADYKKKRAVKKGLATSSVKKKIEPAAQ